MVTGASTGIGRACALALQRSGWQVFAGVRKESDANDLMEAGPSGLTPLRLDVTDEGSMPMPRAESARPSVRLGSTVS